MNSKVVIVLAGNMETSPYYRYYTDVLEKHGISYDIIYWDRLSLGVNGNYCFKYPSSDDLHFLKKLYDYSKYASFVKKIIFPSEYSLVIVFTIANAIFLGSFLIRNFQKKYIIDIRDYSPMVPMTCYKLTRIFVNAKQIFISSPEWKKWLPEKLEYTISHNVRLADLLVEKMPEDIRNKHVLNISTFGRIRDYKTNQRLIQDLRNSDRFMLEFNGSDTDPLKNYANRYNIQNIKFGSRYQKEQEKYLIERADLINILLPRSIAHDGIMSNRFYQALIFRKPVIVNEGNIQADYVNKHNLGLVLKSNENLLEKLSEYKEKFDIEIFGEGCKRMICEIKNDIQIFENALESILMR